MIEIEADYTNRIEKIGSVFTAEPCTLERGTYTEWQWSGDGRDNIATFATGYR